MIKDRQQLRVEVFPTVFSKKTEISLLRLGTSPPQYFIHPRDVKKPLRARLRCRAAVNTGKLDKPKLEWKMGNTALKTRGQFIKGKRRCFVGLRRTSCEQSLNVRPSGLSVVRDGIYSCLVKTPQSLRLVNAAIVLKKWRYVDMKHSGHTLLNCTNTMNRLSQTSQKYII